MTLPHHISRVSAPDGVACGGPPNMTATDQHDDVAETADVQVFVSDIKPVRGRGNITYECAALVEIGGIPIHIHGVTLRNDRPREVGVYLPQFRSGDGVWHAALSLPPAVERAIARAALEQAGGIVMSEPIKEPT